MTPLTPATAHRVPASRGAGIASVTALRAPRSAEVGIAAVQGTLALDFTGRIPEQRRPPLLAVPEARADLHGFALRFSAAVVEVLGGDRGPQQLLRWTSEEVYADLVRRNQELAATTAADQRVRRLRAQVRSVHLACPSDGAAELSVHVRHGQRSRALAARLEWVEGRWQCVALEFC